jgi:D-3-phosphoglycerate dehydrogenase / 2-oxoglutarate reductase
MSFKVLCRSGLLEGAEEELVRIDAQLIVIPITTEDDIIARAQDVDATIVGATEPYTRRAIEALKKCKVISRMGIGVDNIDLAAATEFGIPVAYIPDAMVEEVSDHAMALLLCLARKLFPIRKIVSEGGWQPGKKDLIDVRRDIPRLNGKTLGLVGLGRIGSAVCRKARAFGMRVMVFDPYVSPAAIRDLGAEPTPFDRILVESDFISLHAALTEETRHLFGLEQFKKMKKTAYLINTSRGGLIDQQALMDAVSKGMISGAGLDVTDPEPPKPGDPLLKMENVILTGHTAFYSQTSAKEMRDRSVEAVILALKGQLPPRIANPEVIGKNNFRVK